VLARPWHTVEHAGPRSDVGGNGSSSHAPDDILGAQHVTSYGIRTQQRRPSVYARRDAGGGHAPQHVLRALRVGVLGVREHEHAPSELRRARGPGPSSTKLLNSCSAPEDVSSLCMLVHPLGNLYSCNPVVLAP